MTVPTYGISIMPVAIIPGVTDIDVDTLLSEGETIQVDCTAGPVTLTLDKAWQLPYKRFYIKKMDSTSHKVKVIAAQGDTIDGKEFWFIDRQFDAMNIISDAISEWLQE